MTHKKLLLEVGAPLSRAKQALILLHGRGSSAEDVLTLRSHLPVSDFYIVAPQATNHTWYPYSFLMPPAENEPWLSSALKLVNDIVIDINQAGIASEKIFIMGFSQGACLTLEYATRYARKWGGIVALTGGLIGDSIYKTNYAGAFQNTKVLLTNSENDPHVPLKRSQESKAQMEAMGASANLLIYPNRPHTILDEEIQQAAKIFMP
jgi:phospholipase/carboxylesterase